jgi:hypothetical protein
LAIVCFGELPFHILKFEPLPCTTCMRISNSQCPQIASISHPALAKAVATRSAPGTAW